MLTLIGLSMVYFLHSACPQSPSLSPSKHLNNQVNHLPLPKSLWILASGYSPCLCETDNQLPCLNFCPSGGFPTPWTCRTTSGTEAAVYFLVCTHTLSHLTDFCTFTISVICSHVATRVSWGIVAGIRTGDNMVVCATHATYLCLLMSSSDPTDH